MPLPPTAPAEPPIPPIPPLLPLPTSPPDPEVTPVLTTVVPASRAPLAACWFVGSMDPAHAQRTPNGPSAQVTTDARMDSKETDARLRLAGPFYSPFPRASEIDRDRGNLTRRPSPAPNLNLTPSDSPATPGCRGRS